MAIVGFHDDLHEELHALMRLNKAGLNSMNQLLTEAADAGDPVGLVVLDSLSQLRPDPASSTPNPMTFTTAFLDKKSFTLIHLSRENIKGFLAHPRSDGPKVGH